MTGYGRPPDDHWLIKTVKEALAKWRIYTDPKTIDSRAARDVMAALAGSIRNKSEDLDSRTRAYAEDLALGAEAVRDGILPVDFYVQYADEIKADQIDGLEEAGRERRRILSDSSSAEPNRGLQIAAVVLLAGAFLLGRVTSSRDLPKPCTHALVLYSVAVDAGTRAVALLVEAELTNDSRPFRQTSNLLRDWAQSPGSDNIGIPDVPAAQAVFTLLFDAEDAAKAEAMCDEASGG